jgi:hypothetical protein
LIVTVDGFDQAELVIVAGFFMDWHAVASAQFRALPGATDYASVA